MDYFLCNNKLYLEQVTDTEMYFCVADYLSYFDKEMVERFLSNQRSYVYETARGTIAPEKMVKLLRAIFMDEILHIKFCVAYSY